MGLWGEEPCELIAGRCSFCSCQSVSFCQNPEGEGERNRRTTHGWHYVVRLACAAWSRQVPKAASPRVIGRKAGRQAGEIHAGDSAPSPGSFLPRKARGRAVPPPGSVYSSSRVPRPLLYLSLPSPSSHTPVSTSRQRQLFVSASSPILILLRYHIHLLGTSTMKFIAPLSVALFATAAVAAESQSDDQEISQCAVRNLCCSCLEASMADQAQCM